MRQTLTIADDVDNSTMLLVLQFLLMMMLRLLLPLHLLLLPLVARPGVYCIVAEVVARYAAVEVCPNVLASNRTCVLRPVSRVCMPSGFNGKSCRYQLVNGVCLFPSSGLHHFGSQLWFHCGSLTPFPPASEI